MDQTSEDDELFRHAIQSRDREIALLWTRSNAMWLVVAICFAAYGVVRNEPLNALYVAIIGFVASACWCFVIIGSKWWQECWEVKMQQSAPARFQRFIATTEEVTGEIWMFKLRRYSVAKALIVISNFLMVMWASAGAFDILRFYAKGHDSGSGEINGAAEMLKWVHSYAPIYLALVAAGFLVILRFATIGRDKVGMLRTK